MKREEKERIARRQRMLAREQGKPVDYDYTTATAPPVRTPTRVKRGAAPPGSAADTADNVKPLSPILRRRKRRRRMFVAALLLVAALFAAYISGLLSGAAILAGDIADSLYLYINRTDGGWPASTGMSDADQIHELAGGFVEMNSEDIIIYSAYGSRIRSLQHGYARPAIAVGNTRFAVYNRTGTEVKIESRSQSLHTEIFENGILLCAMSNNGSLAVVTESDRYAAELQVLSPSFRKVYTWLLTQEEGTPISVDFAPDNHRFAAGTVAARDGQLCTTVYVMDTNRAETGPAYTADTGSMIIELQWLGAQRLLAVFDTYAVILDPSTATETARYDYGGATLQSFSVGGSGTALLLVVRGGNTLVTLDENLAVMAMIPAGQADRVDCVETAVYLLTGNLVESYSFTGIQNWQKTLTNHPTAVLDAQQTLVFYGDTVDVLTPPDA